MLDEMKEAGRSKQSETVVKKKSPSKEKKRRRAVEWDSESSDYSSETTRQKVDKHEKHSAVYKGAYLETKEFQTEKRASSGLDVFEFDEYDGLDDITTTKFANIRKHIWSSYGNHIESGKGGPRTSYDATSQSEIEDDDFDLPLSVLSKKYRSSSNQPIRLKGKNGAVKVMVNNKKQVARAVHKKEFLEIGDNKDGGEVQTSKTDDTKSKEKGGQKSLKPMVEKTTSESEIVKITPIKKPQNVNILKDKESHGNDTERKRLREKIKNMLLDAGWTIGYRPRKNKNYMDAIYTNPSGTAYWSIIKAYETLEKDEDDPLPVEILGKFARQTQKKTETELKTKRKYEGCSKRAMEDTDRDDDDGRRSRKSRRCTLLVRDSNKVLGNEDSGKRTILAWLIDSGVVRMSEHVEYMNVRKTRLLKKGRITREGIQCGCCNKILTVLKFEEHSGSKVCNPFPNMFVESGKSLMQCQIDAWSKLGELEQKGFHSVDVDGDDPNDDTCGVCGDGGDLICCDGCPSAFHQTCLDIEMLPEGDWLCPNCSCKYCGEIEASLVTCRLCYKKYHESCRPGLDLKPSETKLSFCGDKCHEMYDLMQKVVGVKHELDSGFSWSLIHRSESDSDSLTDGEVSCNSMLVVSMSVMDECFLPFTDTRSGTNLIRNVVFNCGSNLSRLNYSGFYTAVLERGDEVVSAASIRLHGAQLAEMPFIGTRHIYRRQGMCRRLLSAIESALSAVHVDKLIIPAVAEHMNTWTDVFGFRPLEESHKQEMKCMNMLVFPGTDMLQKPLNAIPQGNNTVKVDDGSALSKKPELISSNDKNAIPDSCSPELDVPLNGDCCLDATKETLPVKDEGPCEPELTLPGKESDSIRSHSDSAVNEVSEHSVNGTNHKEVPYGSEMNRKEKERGTSEGGSSSKTANNLTGLRFCNKTTDGSGLSKKSEMVSSNMAECSDKTIGTHSGAQEPELQLLGKESDSVHSHSDLKVNEIALRSGNGTNPLPTHVHNSIPISKESLDLNTQVVGNTTLEVDTELTFSKVVDKTHSGSHESGVPLGDDFISSPVKDESGCEPQLQLPGKEPDSINSHSDSKVDETAVQNGIGTNPKGITINQESGVDLDSDASKETHPLPVKDVMHSTCKLTTDSGNSTNGEPHFQSIQKSTLEAKVSASSSEEMPGKESDSKAAVQNGSETTQVPDDDKDSFCLQTDKTMMNRIASDSEATEDFTSLGDGCSFGAINHPGKDESPCEPESDSIHSHSNCDGTDQVHDANPSDIPCEVPSSEPKFQQPGNELGSHSDSKVDKIAMEKENGGEADKDNIQFLQRNQASCESEMNIKERETSIPETI